ncbi:hypothetical protein [Acidovorax sp.]|uniref:hypothetical protein n=1 Tax=Acidovorax sp. TaxID=1872122 RepID=UPI002617E4FA|nr:hypothetical protein [Acidovorax sp.]
MRAPTPFVFPPPPLLLLRQAACLALLAPALWPLAALAQGPVVDAAQPTAPTAPLVYQPLATAPTATMPEPEPEGWREANDAVAAFPRGHADILAWEARQGAAPAAPAATTHQGHHGMRQHHHSMGSGGKP